MRVFRDIRFLLAIGFLAVFFLWFLSGAREGNTVVPNSASFRVPDNAALAHASPRVYPEGLWRVDYAFGNDAPPLFYMPLSGLCAANGLKNDGGRCVDSGDGNSWKARFPASGIDWREFGVVSSAPNNQTGAQSAANAASVLGLPLVLCGAGIFATTAPLYYYPYMTLNWCPGTILQKNFFGAALVPASKIGDTYPALGDNAYNGSLPGVIFRNPNIDLNLLAGTGILLAATVNGKILNSNIFNVAPAGTWTWVDQEGTGTLPNGGIVAAGGNVNNVENIKIDSGSIGNAITPGAPYNYTNCAHMGGAGIVFTVPSQDTSYTNPPNGNTIENVSTNCVSIGVQNDYGTDNRFIELDSTFDGLVGISQGTFGHYDLVVEGSVAGGGGDTIGLTFASPTISGSPYRVTYRTHRGDTPATAALGLAGAITSDLSAYGISASVPSGTSNLVISYGEISAALTTSAATSAGNAVLHFTSVPEAIRAGDYVVDAANGAVLHSATEVSSKTGTTVVLSAGVTGAGVAAGDRIIFPRALGFTLNSIGALTLHAAHTIGRSFMSQIQGEGNGLAAYFIGPNVQNNYTIDSPGSNAGSPQFTPLSSLSVLHQHNGADGAQSPVVRNYFNPRARGTYVNSSFTADCVNDAQPYLLNTNQQPVTITLDGRMDWGTVCQFVDAAGHWAINKLTIAAPKSYWGPVTVQGQSSQEFATSWGAVTLANDAGTWSGAGTVVGMGKPVTPR